MTSRSLCWGGSIPHYCLPDYPLGPDAREPLSDMGGGGGSRGLEDLSLRVLLTVS